MIVKGANLLQHQRVGGVAVGGVGDASALLCKLRNICCHCSV